VAGAFTRTISIDYPVVETDATYGPGTSRWERLTTCQAELQDVLPSRSESVKTGLEMARNLTRLRMRWRGDVDSTMRVVVHGDADLVYQIVSGPAEIHGRKHRMELVIERYSSSGADT
jgi:head-tail adaptor